MLIAKVVFFTVASTVLWFVIFTVLQLRSSSKVGGPGTIVGLPIIYSVTIYSVWFWVAVVSSSLLAVAILQNRPR